MEKVIVVVGPTCSGKSGLAFEIAMKLNTEIISADSRQVYKYLTIGSAKPSEAELTKVKHHLINHSDPDVIFNAGIFVEKAERIISRLHAEKRIPIVVGGTGLYIKSLIDGIINSIDTNEEMRKDFLDKRKQFGNEYLYEELKKVDSISAATMLPQNWKRVIRALEVYYITGKSIWQHFKDQKKNNKFIYLQFGLDWEREILYRRIEDRVDSMIKDGLVHEVKSLLAKGYSKQINALNTVGYKEIISYLENEISLERAIELIKRNTRHYAKRQMTWFRKDKRIIWFKIEQKNQIDEIASKIVLSIR